MISLIDECLGQLISQLDAQGMLDNTWIVYSSDHGEMLGDHGLMAKFNFYRSSVQVPLIVRPREAALPLASDALAAVVDIGPTLLDVAGAEPLEEVRGRSLLPVISQDEAGERFCSARSRSNRASAGTDLSSGQKSSVSIDPGNQHRDSL